MKPAEATSVNNKTLCDRSYGRAELYLDSSVELPAGRFACKIRDISIGGAKIECQYPMERGTSVWLRLKKAMIFATVRWSREGIVGLKFEEKIPKDLVLHLRGEITDQKRIEELETKLAAKNWVMGSDSNKPKSVRIAEVLGNDPHHRIPKGVAEKKQIAYQEKDFLKSNRSAIILIAGSAAIGSLIGIASIIFI